MMTKIPCTLPGIEHPVVQDVVSLCTDERFMNSVSYFRVNQLSWYMNCTLGVR